MDKASSFFFFFPFRKIKRKHIHTCYFLATSLADRVLATSDQKSHSNHLCPSWCNREDQLHRAWFKAQTMSSGMNFSFLTPQHFSLGTGSIFSLQVDAGCPRHLPSLPTTPKGQTLCESRSPGKVLPRPVDSLPHGWSLKQPWWLTVCEKLA